MSETVSRSVSTPSHGFNKEDKSASPVTYLFGERQKQGDGVEYVHGKIPRGSSPGKSHKQSKNAGVGGTSYRGHGGGGFPAHGKFD